MEYAEIVGKELMLTAPTDHNKYVIQGLPRHTTFRKVVENLQSPRSELGVRFCTTLHYIKSDDKGTTDMMVLANTKPGGQDNSYATMGNTWLRIGKHVKTPRPNA